MAEALGTRLKTLRMEAKLSQNQLARKADLDRSTISSAENGKNVSEITVAKLAAALSSVLGRDITPDSILSKGGDDDTDDPGPSIR